MNDFLSESRRSTLVFCVNLEHVRDLTSSFRLAGVDARYIHSGTKLKERENILSSFRKGDFPVLVNCGEKVNLSEAQTHLPFSLAILTEGADIPSIDCVVIARPTKSRNLFSQMVVISVLVVSDS